MPPHEGGPRPGSRWAWAAAVLAFCLVATLNAGGYRFGVGDQAFYLPAIERHLVPESFPRDRVVIDDQDRLNVFTAVLAGVSRATGVGLPGLFAGLYVAALGLLVCAAAGIGRALGAPPWGLVALGAALTLRHRVGMTGANTLEGYGHPRMLAFAIGLAAVLAFLKGRSWLAMAAVGLAFVVHPTTALWFGVWVGVALAVSDRGLRPVLLGAGVLASAAAGWAVWRGPLRPQIVRMDAEWLGVLAGKDYLFPHQWPATMWIVAAAYVAVPAAVWWRRRQQGRLHPRETALMAGALALAAIFALAMPFITAAVALAVQLQVSRVFWLLDVLATILAVGALTGRAAQTGRTRAVAVAAVLATAAVSRGIFVTAVEHPERPLARVTLPADEWQDAMAWLRTAPRDAHVLADPGHAWRYGTSVRVSARRDVYLEEVKDTAMAMYSRRVAMRTVDRIRALGDMAALSPEGARALAARYDLDYLVSERSFDLPVVYRNTRFAVYRLSPGP